jgi:L-asparagine transporter-like permease
MFSKFMHLGTESAIAIVQGTQLLLKLVVGLGVVHMIVGLQACKIQELWNHGGFHPDFKGKPWRPGTM